MSNSAPDSSVLDRIYAVIESRRGANPDTSNTARLFAKGTEKIAQKLGEEAVETVIEGVRGRKKELIAESADLLYNLVVLWVAAGVKPQHVDQAMLATHTPPPTELTARLAGSLS